MKIQEVCYTWSHLDGAAKIISFAVWADRNTYELHFNTRSYIWRLAVVDFVTDSTRKGFSILSQEELITSVSEQHILSTHPVKNEKTAQISIQLTKAALFSSGLR